MEVNFMNNLFIIGNGFDLAHKIKSSYEDFRLYLVSLLEKITGRKYGDYDFTDSSDIITIDYSQCPENELLTILFFLSCAEGMSSIDNCYSKEVQWKNIEKSVGEFNYDAFSWIYVDESNIDKEYRANWINEDMFSPYIDVLTKIPEYVKRWIKQVDISNARVSKNLNTYFKPNTKFICFNYTSTLERIYSVKKQKICYIHGNVNSGQTIYFGHGNNYTYDDYINSIDNPNYFSVAEGYTVINDMLRKPVEKIINDNLGFFESLKNIDKIYSYGFSYSEVDQPYIRMICEYIPSTTEWYLHSYPDLKEKENFKKVIRQCGFDGVIKEFD